MITAVLASGDASSIHDPIQVLTVITLAGTVLVLAWQARHIVEGAQLPTDPVERSRAQTMCEMLCDALEASLETAARVPGGAQDLSGWPDWASWVLDRSPGSADDVTDHARWSR